MEGEVAVKTPSPDILEDEQVTPQGFLLYMLKHFEDINWEKLPDGLRAHAFFIEEMNNLEIDISDLHEDNYKDVMIEIDNALS